MSYYDELVKWKDFDFEGYFNSVTDEEILKSIEKDKLSVYDYLNLYLLEQKIILKKWLKEHIG